MSRTEGAIQGAGRDVRSGPAPGPAAEAGRDARYVELLGESPFEWAAALYRSIVDTSPDAITVVGVDGRVLLCNQQAALMHGFQHVDEMVGVSAWQFVAPEDLERATADFQRTIQGGSLHNVEYTLLRPDGSRVPIELSASVIVDREPRPRAFIGVVRDITDRKRSEEALRRSEEYFRRLIENAPDLITVIEPTGEIRYQSPSVERILGYSAEEMTGRSIWEIIHPEDVKIVGDAIARGVLEPALFELIVFRARHQDKSWRYLEGSGKIVRDDSGAPYGIINSRDVTDRILAERALEESEQRKRAILETALDAIITIDKKSRVLEFNPAAEAMFGLSAADVIGKPLEELIVPPAEREKHRTGMKRFLETGKGPIVGKRVELTALRADGSEFPVEVAVVPIEWDGVPVFTGHIRDLTERRRWEEELQQAREELESKVEGRMEVGEDYGLSFRELTVLHLIARGKADKEIAVTLGISSQTVNKHVARILHKMGASSRTEAGVRAIRDGVIAE